jgi:adenylate cyclase
MDYNGVVTILSNFAFQFMNVNFQRIFNELDYELELHISLSKFSAALLQEKKPGAYQLSYVVNYTFHIMDKNTSENTLQSLASVFWGDEQGNYVIAMPGPNGSVTSEVINNIHSHKNKKTILRNAAGEITKTIELNQVTFDPRNTFWYNEAKNRKQTIVTIPYRLPNVSFDVITIATPMYNNKHLSGIFGLNIRTDYLQDFINKIQLSPNSIIFIINEEGRLITIPKILQNNKKPIMYIKDIYIPWVSKAFEEYFKEPRQKFTYKSEGKTYIASYYPLKNQFPSQWYIMSIAPQDDFIGEANRMYLIIFAIGVGILILGIIFISTFVSLLVKSFKKIIKETEKIKNFELEGDTPVQSHIKEIIAISNALQSMKVGLRAFKKYVPTTLVRNLIKTGQEAHIGGKTKNIALFFSDIKDFTPLAEKMDPDALSVQLYSYFETLSKVIVKARGTVDKYIGDSIMAMWGAPLHEKAPCQQAALAALRCQASVDKLNNQWKSEGKPPLITRIGIHFGSALVGTFGSSVRFSYTALGDAVNIASRLEGINKIYGTKIIVSDAVYQIIKNEFALRFLDYVEVKGKTVPMPIYELLAENRSQLSFDLLAYQDAFQQGYELYLKQEWDNAEIYFNKCLTIFPKDTIAPLYIQRCQHAKLHL